MNKQDNYLLNYSDDVVLNNLEEVVVDLSLESVDIVSTGGCTGVIVNSTGVEVEGATVKIFDLNFNPIKHTMTNSAGVYSITGISSGEYIVYAVKKGYEMSTKRQITITDEILTLTDIAITANSSISLGTLYGMVYDSNKKSLSKVLVTLTTVGEVTEIIAQTYSASDGEYVFYNIEDGIYEVNALNDDYILTTSFEVQIEAGINSKENIYMDKLSSSKEGTINGIIIDSTTSVPLASCFVGLYELDDLGEETLISVTTTNRDGKYFFGYVAEGKYVVKAKSTIANS